MERSPQPSTAPSNFRPTIAQQISQSQNRNSLKTKLRARFYPVQNPAFQSTFSRLENAGGSRIFRHRRAGARTGYAKVFGWFDSGLNS
jgi:hypothetical protein